MDDSKKGKAYAPLEYEVGREKIREYANAIGVHAPVHHDREAAKAAGYRDVVAPPMFAVVYSAGSVAQGVLDPELGIDLGRMLHGSQEFVWGEPVCSGDTITTTTTLADLYERAGDIPRARDLFRRVEAHQPESFEVTHRIRALH